MLFIFCLHVKVPVFNIYNFYFRYSLQRTKKNLKRKLIKRYPKKAKVLTNHHLLLMNNARKNHNMKSLEEKQEGIQNSKVLGQKILITQ